MRSIVRFSVDGEKTGALRNKLAAALERYGYARNVNVTATWEHGNISEANQSAAMKEFWDIAVTHKGVGKIDHFWMNADNPPDAVP